MTESDDGRIMDGISFYGNLLWHLLLQRGLLLRISQHTKF